MLPLLVSIGFQILFHSPPGVLFTFPSRYYFTIGHQGVFSLGRWSSRLPTKFLVSRGTLDAEPVQYLFHLQDYHFLRWCFPALFGYKYHILCSVLNPNLRWFGLFPVRSPLLRKSNIFFLLLRLLRCFSSPGLSSISYVFTNRYLRSTQVGSPIRISLDQSLFAAPQSISVLIPSFIDS